MGQPLCCCCFFFFLVSSCFSCPVLASSKEDYCLTLLCACPISLCWACLSSVWLWQCSGGLQVSYAMQKLHPIQACSLQGCQHVNADILAVKDLGTGSGWQQSKQNWALHAVEGH